ncbi:hypothetical protein PMIN06_000784 [Paraphaeosphaeria minitans]
MWVRSNGEPKLVADGQPISTSSLWHRLSSLNDATEDFVLERFSRLQINEWYRLRNGNPSGSSTRRSVAGSPGGSGRAGARWDCCGASGRKTTIEGRRVH